MFAPWHFSEIHAPNAMAPWSLYFLLRNDVSSAATATFAGAWVAPCGARKHSVKAVDVVDEASFTGPVSWLKPFIFSSIFKTKVWDDWLTLTLFPRTATPPPKKGM